MFIDGQINIKIIKKSEKQQEAASIRSKINKVHSKPKNYMPKSNMSSRKALSKITKPQDYNGKLGIFKSKVPMPYKPIPTKLQTVNSGEIQISASPIETPVSLAETKPEKSIRNKELENVRGQVLNSMTEGDEVLFKSVSSFEDNNKDTSINNPTQEESKINLKAAQDLLNSTKQRIDEIEKDLMLVNNAESPNQIAGVTPKSFPKVPQLNRDQLKAVQGEKSEDSQINKSNAEPLTDRVEIDENVTSGQTHFSKLLYQGRKPPKNDSQEDSEINFVTESPAHSNKKKNTGDPKNDQSQKEGHNESDKNEDQEDEEDEEDDSQIPLLFVDVNLGKGVMKRIILYEGDDPKYIAEMFAKDNKLEENMKSKLERLLKKQMDGVLSKIDEDEEDADSNH